MNFYTPVFKTGRIMIYRLSIRPSVCPFHMSRSNLRTPWAIHFKLRIVIEIDSLMVCILFGEISIFHSRVMGLYSSNCRRFFICCTVNWEPLGQFISNFAQLLELIVLRSVYFLVKFRFFIQELWKESLYKYCMNVDDGRIMRSWRSCLLVLFCFK
jgi:hypothetical protein